MSVVYAILDNNTIHRTGVHGGCIKPCFWRNGWDTSYSGHAKKFKTKREAIRIVRSFGPLKRRRDLTAGIYAMFQTI